MADLMTSNSTWSAGTTDTASTLQNGIDQKRAEHINGPASAIISIEQVLGPAASLRGVYTDLATRLAQQIPSDGLLFSPGMMMMYGGSLPPVGWLICDGSSVSRTVFSALFAVIGTSYGPGLGDGLTFSLPPGPGRTPVGAGSGVGGGASGASGTKPSGGSPLTARARGDWFGSETHQLSVPEMPAHTHDATAVRNVVGAVAAAAGGGGNKGELTQATTSAGSSQPHNNLMPSFVVNYIIKT